MSQTELDLDNIPRQELLDNINRKQEVIVYLIEKAMLVNQALAGIYAQQEKKIDSSSLKPSIDNLASAITAAAAEANKLTDDLLKYKKDETQ